MRAILLPDGFEKSGLKRPWREAVIIEEVSAFTPGFICKYKDTGQTVFVPELVMNYICDCKEPTND